MTEREDAHKNPESAGTSVGMNPDSSSCYIAPPPPCNSSSSPYSTIPPGWATAADPKDGRLYYIEQSTGRTSWTHPNAPSPQPSYPSNRNGVMTPNYYENIDPTMMVHADHNPRWAHRRPDNHQCSAVAAFILCFPLGVFALYHSWQTDEAWKQGRYGDAIVHARQTPQYASWGIAIGSIFWILWFFFKRGNDEWEWPELGNLFND